MGSPSAFLRSDPTKLLPRFATCAAIFDATQIALLLFLRWYACHGFANYRRISTPLDSLYLRFGDLEMKYHLGKVLAGSLSVFYDSKKIQKYSCFYLKFIFNNVILCGNLLDRFH